MFDESPSFFHAYKAYTHEFHGGTSWPFPPIGTRGRLSVGFFGHRLGTCHDWVAAMTHGIRGQDSLKGGMSMRSGLK